MSTSPQPTIILASASPRRSALLRAAGIAFEIHPSSVDESRIAAPTHREFATRAAMAKALDVARDADPGTIVIGADTIVCLDEKRLGKPADRAEARAMLEALESRQHTVMTGLAVCCCSGSSLSDCVETSVWFGPIPPSELEECLDTPEPYDKAGAYAIQGWAGGYIERIDGDWHNVVGLPLERLLTMLGEFIDVDGATVPPARWQAS